MSRTDIDAATFADYLRQMCGDGSVEWSYEPMQTSVLLDIADMLDENAKLRELVAHLMYVKPRDVSGIVHDGKMLRFDDLLAEVGMRWEGA